MAKFKLTETIHSEKVRTVRLGDKTTHFGDAEQSKLVKLADDSRYVLTEVGDPIEGIVSSVNGATVDGYTIGGIVQTGTKEVILDGLQATPGTGNIAVGDLVVTGRVTARGTALTQGTFGLSPKVCKATDASAHVFKWRVESLLDGAGTPGLRALIVRI